MDYLQFSELKHSGILGMKWGIRRYQNKDGTLTEAGKKRYAKLSKEMNKLQPKSENKSKSISDYTNDELRERTTRLNVEKDYMNAEINRREAALKYAPPAQTGKGKKFIQKYSTIVFDNLIVPGALSAGQEYLKKEAKKRFGYDINFNTKINNNNNDNKDKK